VGSLDAAPGLSAIPNCREPASATECSVCADGFIPLTESVCGPCPSDSACVNNTVTVCAAGTFRNANSSACLPCLPGNACSQGQQTACAPGTFQDQSGRATCSPCGIGRYTNESAWSQAACPPIPPGLYSPVPNATEVSLIFSCPQGSFCINGVATLCPVGSFQILEGQSACDVCPLGSYNPTAGRSTPCLVVSSGFESIGVSQRSAVRPCDPGFFCTQGVSSPCPALTFASAPGAAHCNNCTRCNAIVPADVRCDATTGLVSCIDRAPPTIRLRGTTPILVPVFQAFADPGVIATDARNTTLDVVVRGAVNITVPGTYNLTYFTEDAFNNTASVSRLVIVQDTPPVARLLGPDPADVIQFSVYVDQGVAITFGSLVRTEGLPLNTSIVGTATITYDIRGGVRVRTVGRTVRILSRDVESAAQQAATAAYARVIAAQPGNTTFAVQACLEAYRDNGGSLQDTSGVVSIASSASRPPSSGGSSSDSGLGPILFVVIAVGVIGLLFIIVAIVLLVRKRRSMQGSLQIQQGAPSILELAQPQPDYEHVYSQYNTVDDFGESRYESTLYDSHYAPTEGYKSLETSRIPHYGGGGGGGGTSTDSGTGGEYESSADPMRAGMVVPQGYNLLTQGPARYAAPTAVMASSNPFAVGDRAPSTASSGDAPHEYVYSPKESDYAYGSSPNTSRKPALPVGAERGLKPALPVVGTERGQKPPAQAQIRLGLEVPGPSESVDDPSPSGSPRPTPRHASQTGVYETSLDSMSSDPTGTKPTAHAASPAATETKQSANSDPQRTSAPAPVVVATEHPTYSQEVPILQFNPAYQVSSPTQAMTDMLNGCRSLWFFEGIGRTEVCTVVVCAVSACIYI
jgi:hypothetical protein